MIEYNETKTTHDPSVWSEQAPDAPQPLATDYVAELLKMLQDELNAEQHQVRQLASSVVPSTAGYGG